MNRATRASRRRRSDMGRRLVRWFNDAPMPALVVGTVGLIAVLVVAMYAIGVVLTVWAWNALIHDLFGGPLIEWWHALALLVLLSIIGGFFKSSVSVEETRRR